MLLLHFLPFCPKFPKQIEIVSPFANPHQKKKERMFPQFFYFKLLLIFLYRLVLGKLGHRDADRTLRRSGSNVSPANLKYQRFASLVHRNDLSEKVIIFNVEGALLRTTSLFPYFMVVAFEAGSILRAVLLLLLYPIIAMLNEETSLKVMVMVSFFGLRENTFRVGSGVLPKHFLEDVGSEGFDVIRRGGKKVGVTSLPNVMVESFLRDYMDVDVVVGGKLKVFHGYYIGVMEEKTITKNDNNDALLKEIEEDHKESSRGHHFIGINSGKRSTRHLLFLRCEEMYIVSGGEKKNWHELPRQSYPRPLIFHDGRLAIKPTPSAFLALLMWFPFGLALSFFRAIVGLFLPYDISIPILSFSGLRLTVSNPNHFSPRASSDGTTKAGLLYVCNHRTLLDPLYLSFTLKRDFTAVTYSLSRVSEILSPIRTVRLTRNRQKDAEMMEALLRQGDLVVCPEGTTCREPYLLRFSPLFSEMSDNIVPVALDVSVSMFYGTTASGLKCFDPLFFLMNPNPSYSLRILEKVSGMMSRCHESESSRFDIANRVQREIGEALGFECTKLTRKDKYLILAGNEGISKNRA